MIVGAYILLRLVLPEIKYQSAISEYNKGNYDDSIEILTSLNGYSNSTEILIEVMFAKGAYLSEQCRYEEAIDLYKQIEETDNSRTDQKQYASYLKGQMYLCLKKYDEAITIFEKIGDYKDAKNLILDCKYEIAMQLIDTNKDSAICLLYELSQENYKDCKQLLDIYATSEWLFQQLAFSNITLNTRINEEFSEPDTNWIYGYNYSFHASFLVTNNSKVPIEGSFYVTMNVARGEDSGNPTMTIIYKLEGSLQPGESMICETETWSCDWYGDFGEAEDEVLFKNINDGNGLRIPYVYQ